MRLVAYSSDGKVIVEFTLDEPAQGASLEDWEEGGRDAVMMGHQLGYDGWEDLMCEEGKRRGGW